MLVSAREPKAPVEVASLVDVLRQQLRESPERVACQSVIYKNKRLQATPLTVQSLAASVVAAGDTLVAHGAAPGDRIVVSLTDPHFFLTWVLGAMARGMVAVPVPTPGEMGNSTAFVERISGVVADCAPRLVIVQDEKRWSQSAGAVALPVLRADSIGAVADATAGRLDALARVTPDMPAVLQYTSGSTSRPKGVVLTHANLVANAEASGRAAGFGPHDRMVSWLPLHHDMGLIGGLLTMLFWRVETFVMTPVTFMARPVNWLQAISAFRGTLSVGPTFAYSLCMRKIPDAQLAGLDLSSWRLAFVGAEAVDAATMEGFAARFAPFGFDPAARYPVYGLAEATLAVSFPVPRQALSIDWVDRHALATGRAIPAPANSVNAMAFVGLGSAVPGHDVRVMRGDTDTQQCSEREVGEVWIAGPSVSPRYFAEDPTTHRLALRSGDLGYVADGVLYLVDRVKDLVIIAGNNYASSDIEAAAAHVPGVRRGRIVAFASRSGDAQNSGTEALHVAAEVDVNRWPWRWRDPRIVADAMKRVVKSRTGVQVQAVYLLAPGTLRKTTSGKLRRSEARSRIENGGVPTIGTAVDVLRCKVATWARRWLYVLSTLGRKEEG